MTSYRLVHIPVRSDARGSLCFAQEPDHIPFTVRRMFCLYDLAPGATRGGHAHRTLHQFLHMLAGGCRVHLDDGTARAEVVLDSRSVALYVPPMVWVDLTLFQPGSICSVLASAEYDESDYIRDYQRFKEVARGHTVRGV